MLVSRVYPTQRPGGMPFVCQDRARQLVQDGHEVHVITTALQGRTVLVDDAGVQVHHTTAPQENNWSEEFASQCLSWARVLAPDIMHSDSLDRKHHWWEGYRDAKFAVTMHGFSMGAFLTELNLWRAKLTDAFPQFDPMAIREEVDALKTADVVMGVSKWEWRMLTDQYGLFNTALVYNPIAPYFFDWPRRAKKRDYYVCVAVSQGNKRGFQIAREAAKRAGVKLRFLENIARNKLPALYDEAKGVILPTAFAQGYDLSIAEARIRGCAAIMTPTGSYLEEKCEADYHCPLGDVDKLTVYLKLGLPREPNSRDRQETIERHKPENHTRNWLNAIT